MLVDIAAFNGMTPESFFRQLGDTSGCPRFGLVPMSPGAMVATVTPNDEGTDISELCDKTRIDSYFMNDEYLGVPSLNKSVFYTPIPLAAATLVDAGAGGASEGIDSFGLLWRFSAPGVNDSINLSQVKVEHQIPDADNVATVGTFEENFQAVVNGGEAYLIQMFSITTQGAYRQPFIERYRVDAGGGSIGGTVVTLTGTLAGAASVSAVPLIPGPFLRERFAAYCEYIRRTARSEEGQR